MDIYVKALTLASEFLALQFMDRYEKASDLFLKVLKHGFHKKISETSYIFA